MTKIDKHDLVEQVKSMVKERGVRWSTSHKIAFDEILEVIDEKFLDDICKRTREMERDAFNTQMDLREKSIVLKRTEEELESRAHALETISDEAFSHMDDKSKNAVLFAEKLAQAFSKMDKDVMQCVSYGIWAYLGGSTIINTSDTEGENKWETNTERLRRR